MGTICRSKNLCSVFIFFPYMRQYVWRDVSIAAHILSFRGCISRFFSEYKMFLIYPNEKKTKLLSNESRFINETRSFNDSSNS